MVVVEFESEDRPAVKLPNAGSNELSIGCKAPISMTRMFEATEVQALTVRPVEVGV